MRSRSSIAIVSATAAGLSAALVDLRTASKVRTIEWEITPMTQHLRLGLVGCGHIARKLYVDLLSAVADEATLVAVCDCVPERAQVASREFQQAYERAITTWEDRAAAEPSNAARWQAIANGCRTAALSAPRVYSDLDAFLGDDFDVVLVTTQPVMHPVISIPALESGRHVFTEGPMAANLLDADTMIDAAHRHNVKLCVQYATRIFREARQAKLAVESGGLGAIVIGRLDASWFHTMTSYFDRDAYRSTWRGEGGGSAFHHGRYGTDLLLHLMGEPVTEVAAFTGRFAHDIEFEDASAAALRFQSGALGQITTTTCAHPNPGIPRDRVEIIGERASLQVYRQRGPEGWRFVVTIASEEPGYAANLQAHLDQALPVQDEDVQVVQLRLFLAAVRDGGDAPISGESARAQVELTRATYKSAVTGQVVSLPLAPDDPFYGPEASGSLNEGR